MAESEEHEAIRHSLTQQSVAAENVVNIEDDDVAEGSQRSSAKRKRPTTKSAKGIFRSWVWEHIEKKKLPIIVANKDGVDEEKGHTWISQCKYCSTDFVYGNSTSTLAKHLETVCLHYSGSSKYIHRDGGGQTFMGSSDSNTLVARKWSPEACTEAATDMIVMDELPFSHVEKPGFKHFCSIAIGSKWKLPCRKTVAKCFLKKYHMKKAKLKREMSSHGVCLTTDTWTSLQNINCMVLTCHFIDNGWNMHKRVLNFCQIANHQGITIGKILEDCIREWGIDKVLTISVDNASANKVAIDYVKRRLISQDKELLMGGKFIHVRCLAHILNIIVRAGLQIMDKSVAGIRNAVRYVRSSSSRLDVFKACVEREGLEVTRVCMLDVPTRWNSTYLMLETALDLKNAFDRMGEEEEKYTSYFTENEEVEEVDHTTDDLETIKKGHKRVGPPSEIDWENAGVFVQFLKVFYDVTLRVSASSEPTSSKAFHDIAAIYSEIEELYNKIPSTSSHQSEVLLHDMAVKMRAKYKKYFGQLEDTNQLFLVALVLDPRYKLKEFGRICKVALGYDDLKIKKKMEEVKELVVALTDLYASSSQSSHSQSSHSQTSIASKTNMASSSGSSSRYTGKMALLEEDWERVLADTNTIVVSHEVDRYLLDPIEMPRKDKEKFSLLLWWKVNGNKYLTLQAIAKDVLAIQVSTVASESTFSTGKRVIDPHRSSLNPSSVEKLICLQNWLLSESITNLAYEPTLTEEDWMEKINTEVQQEERERLEKKKDDAKAAENSSRPATKQKKGPTKAVMKLVTRPAK